MTAMTLTDVLPTTGAEAAPSHLATVAEAPAVVRRPRRIPMPVSEPPYDEELSTVTGPGEEGVEGTLALAFDLPTGVPAVPAAPVHAPPARLRLVPRDPDEDPEFAAQPTSRANLPNPRFWAARLAQAVVEVLGGLRPAGQLVRWTSADVHADIVAQIGPVAALRGRPTVRSVHVCEPADGIAEVSVTVRRGERSEAMALRLEGVDGRWQCTVLQLG